MVALPADADLTRNTDMTLAPGDLTCSSEGTRHAQGIQTCMQAEYFSTFFFFCFKKMSEAYTIILLIYY